MPVSKNPLVNYLVFPALFGMLAAIAWLSYASVKSADVQETNLMAYSQKHGIVFNVDRTLYRTDVNGHLIEKIGIRELGLGDVVGDIAFAGDYLLAARGDTHDVLRCGIPLGTCELLTTIDRLNGVEALDIAVTPDGKYFYVSCSNAHRLLYYDIDGTFKYRLSVNETLRYPNDLIALGEGRIVVTDTYNHRIAVIEHNGENATVAGEISVEDGPGRYSWPTALTLTPDGRLWVLAQNFEYSEGEIVAFETLPFPFAEAGGQGAIDGAAVPVTGNINPVTPLLAVEEDVLISDKEKLDLLRLSSFSGKLESFGDDFIRSALKSAGADRDFWDMQILLSQAGIAIFILMLIAGAVLEYKSTEDKQTLFTRAELPIYEGELSDKQTIRPDIHGVIWLFPKPPSKMTLYGIRFLFGSMTIVALVSSIYIVNELNYDVYLILMLAGLTVMMGLTTVGVEWMLKIRRSGERIGTDGENIYLVWMSKQAKAPASEVKYTGLRIMIDDVSILLRDKMGEIYDEVQMAKYINPLLKEAKHTDEFRLEWERLKRKDPLAWFGLVVFVLLLGILLWTKS